MLYVITLDPGTVEERMFVVSEENYEAELADLENYCDSLDVSAAHGSVEILQSRPTFRLY